MTAKEYVDLSYCYQINLSKKYKHTIIKITNFRLKDQVTCEITYMDQYTISNTCKDASRSNYINYTKPKFYNIKMLNYKQRKKLT